jgi:hypothetical protein
MVMSEASWKDEDLEPDDDNWTHLTGGLTNERCMEYHDEDRRVKEPVERVCYVSGQKAICGRIAGCGPGRDDAKRPSMV